MTDRPRDPFERIDPDGERVVIHGWEPRPAPPPRPLFTDAEARRPDDAEKQAVREMLSEFYKRMGWE